MKIKNPFKTQKNNERKDKLKQQRKITAGMQAFMTTHQARVQEEGHLMQMATPDAFDLSEYIALSQAEVAAMVTLTKIFLPHDQASAEQLQIIFHDHHPDLKNYAVNIDRFPQLAEQFNQPQKYLRQLLKFFQTTRQQMLFEQAEAAKTQRLQAEAALLKCPEAKLLSQCEAVLTLMRKEMALKEAYWQYITYDTPEQKHPKWGDFDGQSHHAQLSALADDTLTLPPLPRSPKALKKNDYAKQLATFILKAREKHAATDQAVASPPKQPSQAKPSKPTASFKQPQYTHWLQRPLGMMDKLLDQPLAHMVMVMLIGAAFTSHWGLIAALGIGCAISSTCVSLFSDKIRHSMQQNQTTVSSNGTSTPQKNNPVEQLKKNKSFSPQFSKKSHKKQEDTDNAITTNPDTETKNMTHSLKPHRLRMSVQS